MDKFKQFCKGYGLVDHENFCVITNEGDALNSVADLVIVVNTNICSWMTHCGRGWDENGWKCDEWKEIKKKRVKRECKVILFDWDERGYKIKDGIKEIKDLN